MTQNPLAMSEPGDPSESGEVLWDGQWLRDARKSRGLAITELAARAGVSTSAIQDTEANRVGSPGLLFVVKLARAMDMPIGALLGEKGGEEYQVGYQTAMIDVQDAIYKLRQQAK